MTKNMNGNSNQIDEVNVEEDQTHCVLEETREVVRKFLQRSLSQNAKNSMTFLKPEGIYHQCHCHLYVFNWKRVGFAAFN